MTVCAGSTYCVLFSWLWTLQVMTRLVCISHYIYCSYEKMARVLNSSTVDPLNKNPFQWNSARHKVILSLLQFPYILEHLRHHNVSRQEGAREVGGRNWHEMPVPFTLLSVSTYFFLHFFFTTVMSQWDFSHGKCWLPSTGKASCDRVVLPNPWCMLGVSMYP